MPVTGRSATLSPAQLDPSSGASGGPPGTHDDSHIAVEQMEKAYQLPQALARVGGVEEPVQLGHRGAEATRKLASAEPGPLRPPPRLHGQLVNQKLGQVARILVVLEGSHPQLGGATVPGLFGISVSSIGTAPKRGGGRGAPAIPPRRGPRASRRV